MAIKVRDAGMAATKFTQRAQAAAGDYKTGVANAGQAWQAASTAAADTYAAGVQTAIGHGSFAKGVAKAGAGKYQDRAANVGAQRYPQGVATAGPAWQAGTQPYLDTLSSLNLPPRRPKGDPANMARVQAVTDALRKRKMGG